MKINLYNLIQNFLLGGFVVSSVSLIGNNIDPVLGAIWWSFPLSLIPTLIYMRQNGRTNNYIAKFTLSTAYALILLFLATGLLAYFIKFDKRNSLAIPIIKTVVIWLFASIIFYGFVKYFDIENKFM